MPYSATSTYCPLKIRTTNSLAESSLSVDKALSIAAEFAVPAIAITDTNNMFATLELAYKARAQGITQIIPACNLYVYDEQLAVDKAKFLTLYAKSQQGYLNLLAIVSAAYLQPFKDSPSINLDYIQQHNEGIIAVSGSADSTLGTAIINDAKHTKAHLQRLQSIFKADLFLSLSRHGFNYEYKLEQQVADLATRYDIPIIATNDIYFANKIDSAAHDALLCIGQGTTILAEDRVRTNENYYFKSPQEMAELFADIPQSLENTLYLAQQCLFTPTTHAPILPTYADDEEQTLKDQASAGLQAKFANKQIPPPYQQRLDYELKVINDMKYAGYFLIVADFIVWAKNKGISVGPGRGSGAGSIIAWALQITELDPIKWGLLFERFLNPERVSMPDFDIDFCQERRDEVIEYVRNKYGHDKVAQIITFGKLKPRAALKDVGRVLSLPYGMVDGLSKRVPFIPTKPLTLQEAIDQDEELQQAQQDEETASLINISLELEGASRHVSTHAAGLVIGDRTLQQLVPLYYDPRATMQVTQFDMKWVEQAGLVKFDFLGLRTLTVIEECCRLIKSYHGDDIDMANLALDDRETFAMLTTGNTAGVFQLESTGMRDVLKRLQPDRFEDIIAIISLYRPGPMENIPQYIDCKHGRKQPEYMHPLLQDMLQETFGVIIYQEQVMEIARILAGYSLGDADLLRRAMGKKNRKEMAEQQQRFLDGAANNNIEPELAKIIFQRVEKFAGYGFNKSHAAAYALISYQTAYLKTHYPQAFMAATMTYDRHNIEKIAFLADEAKKEGIKLLAPSIDKSVVEFNLESINDDDGRQVTAIRHSLVAIKGMGENVAETIINKRQAGIWASFEDMVHDVTPQVINKKSLEGLIYGGACDLFGNNRSTLITNIENVFASYASKQNSSSLFGDELSVTTTLKEETEFVDSDKLLHEKNVIGFYVSSHPLDKYRAIIQDLGVSHIKDITPESTGFYQLCAIINNKRERRAESGKRYAFLSCADNTGVIDISTFSEVLEKNRQLLEDQSKVLILSVDIQLKEGRQRLTLQQVKDIDQYILENRTAVSLHLADDFTSFTELRHVINGWQQGCKNISIYYKGYKFGISNKYDITIKCLQDCTSLGVKYLVE